MTTETLIFLILIILLIGAIPSWPYSSLWGYRPMGILAGGLVIFLIWAMVSDRPLFRSSGSLKSTAQEAGQNLKEAGRDVADSIRDVAQ